MSNWKALGRVVLAIAAGGLASGPALAGTTLECTDETRGLHEYVAGQATSPPGETNAAPIEAVAEVRGGNASLPDGSLVDVAPKVVPGGVGKNPSGMGR